MKILIIGAAGMIGMRLAKSIVKDDFSGRINDITLFDANCAWRRPSNSKRSG